MNNTVNFIKKTFEIETLKNGLYITIGCAILAITLNLFLLPNKISTGGFSGIATIVYYYLEIPVSITILLLNIPLFVISIKVLGFKFMLKAVLSTILYIVLVSITSPLKEISWLVPTGDKVISTIFGGILAGTGMSFIFNAGSSTGGTDILAQIINKKITSASTSKILLIIDSLIIIATTIFFKSVTIGLYSIIAIYLSKKVIEIFFEGINLNKEINIITKEGVSIAKAIRKNIHRGVTYKKCEEGYEKDIYYQVICVVNTSEINKIKKLTKKIDEKAFMYITPASEVMGLGFRKL